LIHNNVDVERQKRDRLFHKLSFHDRQLLVETNYLRDMDVKGKTATSLTEFRERSSVIGLKSWRRLRRDEAATSQLSPIN